MSNLAALLTDALVEQGRLNDAGRYASLARDEAQQSDASAQVVWRMATARVLVRRGEVDDAVKLAEEAIHALSATHEAFTLSYLLIDQAEVLELAQRPDDAIAALREAVRVSEQKGATALVRRANDRLERLVASRS